MTIVLSFLYPARYYLVYRGSIATLVFTVGFGIFAGYMYMLVTSVKAIVTKKVKLTAGYIKDSLLNFIVSYVCAMIYIAVLNCFILLLNRHGVSVNIWILRCACLFVAWCIGKFPILKKIFILVPTTIILMTISAVFKLIPISFNPENYVLILILLLCQTVIRPTVYERIPVEKLKKGMILSAFSSVLMQQSVTKGLPVVSTEDLKSRLTDDEINSVKIWAIATHTEELTIVRKIPFAVFISAGFLIYFIFWSVLG